jgi:hypothetical protein
MNFQPKTIRSFIIALFALFLASGAVLATDQRQENQLGKETQDVSIPETIFYQGQLVDVDGEALPDGVYSITFGLYDQPSGESALWAETQQVQVNDSLFSVELGDTVALTHALFAGDRWLGVQLGTASEMTPRQPVASVVAAFVAENASLLDGYDSVDFQLAEEEVRTAEFTFFPMQNPILDAGICPSGTKCGVWLPDPSDCETEGCVPVPFDGSLVSVTATETLRYYFEYASTADELPTCDITTMDFRLYDVTAGQAVPGSQASYLDYHTPTAEGTYAVAETTVTMPDAEHEYIVQSMLVGTCAGEGVRIHQHNAILRVEW